MYEVGGDEMVKPAVRIRIACRDDMDEILSIQKGSGRSCSEGFMRVMFRTIDDPARLVLLAQSGTIPVGWATTKYWPDDDGAAPAGHYLMGITVVPAHRRQGIGKQLIAARIEWIHERADSVMFFTNADNIASFAAHSPWPFQEIARASHFRGIPFENGLGLLFKAQLT